MAHITHIPNLSVRPASIVVAASDSRDKSKADYVCDGTNDQIEIQNAIDKVSSAGGGDILLLDGTFNISSDITIKDGVRLIGHGTVFNVPADATVSDEALIETDTTGISNIAIENIRFTVDSSFTKSIIRLRNVTNAEIRNIVGTKTKGAFIDVYRNNKNIVVSRCRISMSGTPGVAIMARGGSTPTDFTENVWVVDNYVTCTDAEEAISAFGWYGLLKKVWIVNNTVYAGGTGSHLISVLGHDTVGHGGMIEDVVLMGNKVYEPGSFGINVFGARNVFIIGNYVYGGDPSIYVQDVNEVIDASGTSDAKTGSVLVDSTATFVTTGVRAGYIVRNVSAGTFAFVVSVDSETQLTLDKDIFSDSGGESYEVKVPVDNATVALNSVEGSTGLGIYVANTSHSSKVVYNFVKNSSSYAIQANCHVVGNYCYGEGIYARTGATVDGNIVIRAPNGIEVYGNVSGIVIRRNLCSENTNGIYIHGTTPDEIRVIENVCTNNSYGINVDAASNLYMFRNMSYSNTTQDYRLVTANISSLTASQNDNYVTENKGTATFSGDGATTTFNIPHGLSSAPSSYWVTPASSDAKGEFYVSADETNLTVTYTSAPPSGSNNVILKWGAEV